MKREWISINGLKLLTRCLYARRMPNGYIVSCGHCYYCRKKQARELAFRCEQEAFDKFVYNILLTYDDDFVPTRNGKMTLNKVHFQDFMKRLREYYFRECGDRLRYLCVGEYGGKKGRPHYHLILFTDIPLQRPKLDFDEKHNRVPYLFYTNKITQLWRRGQCDIETMHNVAGSVKYLVQYMLTHDDPKRDPQVEKPFRLMSRGRGLGYRWLERTKLLQNRCNKYKDFTLPKMAKDGSVYKIPIPRYYQRKFVLPAILEERSQDWYWQGIEYMSFERSQIKNYGTKRIEEIEELRERERREQERAYREAKVHENDRSATRVFARAAKNRKGRSV